MEKARNPNVAPETLDVNHLAEMLGMSRTALFKIRKNDSTFPEPAFKSPKRWTRSQIMQWLDYKANIVDDAEQAGKEAYGNVIIENK